MVDDAINPQVNNVASPEWESASGVAKARLRSRRLPSDVRVDDIVCECRRVATCAGVETVIRFEASPCVVDLCARDPWRYAAEDSRTGRSISLLGRALLPE